MTVLREELLALMRPSASKRWLNCPASVRLQHDNPSKVNTRSSTFADEGTLAHATAEAVLLGKPLPKGLKAIAPMEAAEMERYARGYANLVRDVLGQFTELHVEDKVPLIYAEESEGTTDACVWDTQSSILHIFDLKYGAGVPVIAEENSQLLLYALGAIRKHMWLYGTPQHIILTVYQPRVHDDLPAERTWEVPLSFGISGWARKVEKTAASILAGEPQEFHPSDDACRFCPCAGFCSARAQFLLEGVPDKEPMPEPSALTIEAVAAILTRAKGIKAFIESVEAYAVERALAGEQVPGFKIVEAVKRRAWKEDESEVTAFLETCLNPADFTKTSLLTPLQVSKLLKELKYTKEAQAVMDEWSIVPRGEPVIAPIADKREAYKPVSADVEFADTK